MQHKYTAICGVPLRPWFEVVLGNVQVLFLHDSAAFILGEVGEDYPCCRVAGVMIGTGLGFALMIDGKPCVTAKGTPLISVWNAPYRDGIAEDYISARAIVRAYNGRAEKPLESAKEIGLLAERDDALAGQTYEEMGRDLGSAVRQILIENEIEMLLIGGQIARSFSVFGDALREALGKIPSLRTAAPIEEPDLVHLRGAVCCWWQRARTKAG